MVDAYESMVQQKARELYKLCDVEKRGFITKNEMSRLNQYLPLNPAQLEAVFNTLDDDGNGQLSLEEFTNGFGNYLVGGMSPVTESSDEEVFGNREMDGEEDQEYEEEQFKMTMDNIGAAGLLDDVDSVKELWRGIRKDNPELLPGLECLLQRISAEVNKTQKEFHTLESVLVQQSSVHDEEVRRLYEEMENQIKTEKERLEAEEKIKERQIRDQLEREIREKDSQYHEILRRHEQTQAKLAELNSMHVETAQEKEELERSRDLMEKRLHDSECSLEDCQDYIEELNKKMKEERRKRAKAAIEMTEGIALEREKLVRQLDKLREMNKLLKDERDEKIMMLRAQRDSVTSTPTLSPSGHTEKRGSLLSNYFTTSLKHDTRVDSVEEEDEMEEYECDIEEDVILPAVTVPRPPTMDIANRAPGFDRPSPLGANADTPIQSRSIGDPLKPERFFKVVFVGDSSVGKSSIIYRFCHADYKDSFCATIGVDFQMKSMLVENHYYSLQLWDTAGQERFRSITKQYYRKADGIVLMYDVMSELSFLNVRDWLDNITEEIDEHQGSILLMLLGNKADLLEEDNKNGVKKEHAEAFAKDYDALFYEVSAKTGYQVEEAFQEMTRLLKDREDRDMQNAFKIGGITEKKKGCCGK